MKQVPQEDDDDLTADSEDPPDYIDILRDKMNTGSGFEIRKTHQ